VDRIPPKLPNTSSRLIAMAASLVGSSSEVMVYMGCSEDDFRKYSAGQKEVPWNELDRLIALIVREQSKQIAKNRAVLARHRARRNGD
jgi:hypothetical protein